MTDTTRTSDDLWSEEGDDEEEQTQVARNPLRRSSRPPAADLSRAQPRSVSSFGSPRSSWPPANGESGGPGSGRPSLYERLVQTGELDDGLVVADKHESSRPLSGDLQRPVAHQFPPAPDLRDLAEALEGEDGRDSSDELRDSDVQMIAPTSKVITRPLRAVPRPDGARSLPSLPALPKPHGNGQVSSILLGPGASMRNDATERFSHMPSTHPLANSIAPTAPSGRPMAPEKRTPTWQVALAALLLVGAGAAIGRFRSAATSGVDQPRTAATASSAEARMPAAPVEPVAKEQTGPARVVTPEALAVPVTSPADETPAAARKRERDARRALRESEASPTPAQPLTPAAATTSATEPAAADPLRVRRPVPSGPLAAQPTREQVVSTMDAMLPELARCVGEKHGATSVTMTVRSTGAVTYALVGGSFAGTPEGSCIARVIKQAQFPAFTDSSIRVSYPFQL